MRMRRLIALVWCGAQPLAGAGEAGKLPITLPPGPQLFLDDYLIERSTGIERKVMSPPRFLDGPIVTGEPQHQNWQAFLTVLHDPTAPNEKPFRMWYNADIVDDPTDGKYQGRIGLLESTDGIHWPGPYRRLDSLAMDGRMQAGASVLDDGPNCPQSAERYKILFYDNDPRRGAGPRVAFSPDGVNWTLHNDGQLIVPKSAWNDIWTAFYDPLRRRYFYIAKEMEQHAWTNAEGRKLNFLIRRCRTGFSQDFKTWTPADGRVFSPDEKDSGITQWYGAAGLHVRGDLMIGFLRVLRDDLTAEGTPKEAIEANTSGSGGLGHHALGADGGAGMGYTGLTWTRDGETWQRDRDQDKFLEPDPKVGAWDHAMAWVSSAVPVGDEVYLYYAGFRWGHKFHHSTDRQIGLVKIKRDRYVARMAGAAGGQITTPVVTLESDQLTLNADAAGGEIRVQVCDADRKPLPGLTFADCRPVTSDSLAAEIQWKGSLGSIKGQPVRLEFRLKNASLFAFEAGNEKESQ